MSYILTAVIGSPVSHSLSPRIHNYWIGYYGLEGAYEAVELLPDNLDQSIQHLVDEGYKGFNVTLPLKTKIMAYCEEVDDAAQKIGAVNVVSVRPDGTLLGSNSDAFGFLENIKDSAPGFSLSSRPALVLGSGGAARAIVYALQSAGVPEIRVANRTKENAEALAEFFDVTVVDWDQREAASSGCGLLVNTTSLGMTGKPALEFDLSPLPEGAVVCDIVYAPQETALLKQAKECGNLVVGGIGMLLHQARPAFKAWYGIMPEITEELRQKVMENVKE